MGKITNIILGGAALGAFAAAAYTYVKKYNAIEPNRALADGEDEERSYSSLDTDRMKEGNTHD